ncbi:MAG TPA: hypothetical protein VFC80_03090 [Sphaerochaeta sp.]|nr:hypothetical protein [Sphaerochaeta sp.]
MRRHTFIITGLVFILALSGCATQSARKYPLPFTVLEQPTGPLYTLSIPEAEISAAGYRTGDWILLRLGTQEIAARLAVERSASYPTLIAEANESFLYIPEADAGKLVSIKELQKQHTSSLNLSGTFVFTF